jgi:hypothetical protein
MKGKILFVHQYPIGVPTNQQESINLGGGTFIRGGIHKSIGFH